MQRPSRLQHLLTLFACACSVASQAAEVSVAVAANFAAPMAQIATAFEQDTGHKAVLSLGSTGKLYAQIRNGAPFHVFLSADQETPARLEQDQQVVPGSRFTYAVGRLVLWSRQSALVDERGEVLRQGRFERIAMADPRLAPYGAAAVQVMDRLNVRRALQGRLVQGENIATAFQWVHTGSATLGFVALSQVMVDGKIAQGSAWVVPTTMHTPLRQDAVALNAGQGNPAAAALLTYLKSERARSIMRAFGYEH